MKVLNLEESKEIVTKFSKYFGIFDEKSFEKYFKSTPKFLLKILSAEELGREFGKTLLSSLRMLDWNKKRIKNFYDSLNKKRFIKIPEKTCSLDEYEHKDLLKHYNDYFEDHDHSYKVYKDFFEVLAKLTNKKIYAISKTWLNKIKSHLILQLMPKEVSTNNIINWNIVNEQKVFLFPENFSFLVILDTCDNIVASDKKFIERFKKNLSQRNCEKYWKLKKGDSIKITYQGVGKDLVLNKKNKIYKISKIEIKKKKHWTDEKYLYLDNDNLVLVVNWLFPWYGIETIKRDKQKIMKYFSEENIATIEII